MALQFKCDENLPKALTTLLSSHGHDALSVLDQGLGGAPDDRLAAVCALESRALVTLDMDFSDLTAYPLDSHAGIIVLRIRDQSRASVLAAAERLLPMLEGIESLHGQLWIADGARVRIRALDEDL